MDCRSLCPQRLRSLLLAAIFFGAFGCTTVSPPVPSETTPKVWQAGELVKAISQRQEQFRSLRALARVSYSGPDGKSGFQEAILVERPDRLRLETITYLGAVLIVTVNDKEITGYHPREGVFLRGERSRENLLRYTQIPLELDEITKLLLGLPPVDGAASEQDGNTVAFSPKRGGRDVVIFASHLPAPTQWQRLSPGGKVEMSAEFAEHIETPTGFFPLKIVFEAQTPKRRLEIRYQEPEVNASLAADFFSQQKPANVKELPIETLRSTR
jgi:Domain of unknown function (DUF4292)